jgi:hypothetical protein
MPTNWLDTTEVVWLDTDECVWKDVTFLSAALAKEAFDEEVFDNVADVTPSDSTVLEVGFLFVGSTGFVKVLSADNEQEMIFNVLTAGSWIKLRIKKVFLSSTTATDIVLAS